MTKAEERAKAYEESLDYYHCMNDWPSIAYCAGYEQEEKDMDKSEPKSINDNIPYKESEVICVNCSYRWFAERAVTKPLKDIECPWCGKQGFVIETGETIKQLKR